jgi:soluble lytic murein transglycosylase-like protein
VAALALVMLPALAGCSSNLSTLAGAPKVASLAPSPSSAPAQKSTSGKAQLDGLILRYADTYDVPPSLIHRVVVRESGYNAGARNGPYYGLMQISYATAKSMGYKGSPGGLLDPDTNLKYAVKYLRGAYIVGRGNQDQAVRLYARGYYYDAKRAGLLEESGLR